MPRCFSPWSRLRSPLSLPRLFKPALDALSSITPLRSRSNRPMTFTFEHHLKALVYLHLQEYESGREFVQVLSKTISPVRISPRRKASAAAPSLRR